MANLLVLLESVSARYGDLLRKPELEYIHTLSNASVPARRLYTRLAMRKGPLFRSDLLTYPEIGSVQAAASDLENAGLIEIDGEFDVEAALATLRVPELRELFPGVPIQGTRKAERIEAICLHVEAEAIRVALGARCSLYCLLGLDILQTIQLLFFGNRYQNLSDFIITELGVVQYERYEISEENRPFSRRDELDSLVAIYELRERFEEIRREATAADLEQLIQIVPAPTGSYHIDRRREDFINAVARQYERIDERDAALALYESVKAPPARERRARIYALRDRVFDAAGLCEDIVEDPFSAEELDFASTFLTKIVKSRGDVVTAKYVPDEVEIPEMTIRLHRADAAGVEQGALCYFTESGLTGFYTENGLWSALFGLVFWDIVFMPIDGVFFNEYQRGPADLSTPDFYQKRKMQIDLRLSEILNLDSFPTWIGQRYEHKKNIANAFVNWKHLDRELLECALTYIPVEHIASVIGRIARNPMSFTSGFPDLVLFGDRDSLLPHSDHRYLLAEVKGPGDHVQRNQRRWFSFFHQHGIPAVVAWVVYET